MNYPNGIKKNFKSSNFINYANRGMKLEDDLNITNNYYRDMDVKGKYVDFEAKETNSLTSFPLNNIHKHQIIHLNNIARHGGIAFIIVRFTMLNETYLLFQSDVQHFLDTQKRKSIPLGYFKECGYLLKDKFNPRVDYLEILDKVGGIINGKKN